MEWKSGGADVGVLEFECSSSARGNVRVVKEGLIDLDLMELHV